MKIKKIYISLPMAGQENTIEERYNKILDFCEQNLPEYDLVFPSNIEQFFDGGNPERTHPYAWYLGQDLILMGECDAILMTKDWEKSFGCSIEIAVAKHTNMKIYYTPGIEI